MGLEEVGAVDLGRESERLPMEKVDLGAAAGTADLRGTLEADEERPGPRAEPRRSLKRLGFDSRMPRREEEDEGGAAEAAPQLLPKMSPTMEVGGLERPDPREEEEDDDEEEGGFACW